MSIQILLASNNSPLSSLITNELRYEGYQLKVVDDGVSALLTIREQQPDLAILDFALSRPSALEICRRLHATQQEMPIILLDEDSINHCAIAFDSGADDYLRWPASIEELVARIRLHLRRYRYDRQDILNFQDLKVDLKTWRVYRGNRLIELTPKEFDLLVLLISHPRQVLSCDRLTREVWGYDFVGESNILQVYIRYLRLKLEANHESRLIHNIRGAGYVLREAFSQRTMLAQ
ncbi:MAG: response regulator transcription factor [Leptolyngbyaceae cyanobacterium MO_188.B28]|nr:response regulator transcription factor [Leptolyngbyaceae cyanobacterium MO_188.B28]